MKNKKLQDYNFDKYLWLIIFITVIIFGGYIVTTALSIGDGYWHIKTGEFILQNKQFTYNCFSSWIMKDKPWIAHEWLFGVIIYLFSLKGFTIMTLTFSTIYMITMLLSILLSGINKIKTVPMIYIFSVCVIQFITLAFTYNARPQSISMLLLVIFLGILEYSLKNKKVLFLLPLISLLWSNVHGGSSNLTYLISIVYFICGSINFSIGKITFEKRDNTWRNYMLISIVLQILSICINPYTIEMLKYPYSNMSDSNMLSLITEWASPDAKNIYILILMILPMILGIISLIQTEDSIKAHEIAIYSMFILLFLRSIRFNSLLVIVQTVYITKYAFKIKIKNKDFDSIKNIKLKIADNISALIIIVIDIAIIICLFTGTKVEEPKVLSDELLHIIKEDNSDRLLNTYNIGGYLIYNNIDVFVDGRYEPYNQDNIIDDFRILFRPKNIDETNSINSIFNKYNFDAVIIEKSDISIYNYIKQRTDFKELYSDDKYIYYSKI